MMGYAVFWTKITSLFGGKSMMQRVWNCNSFHHQLKLQFQLPMYVLMTKCTIRLCYVLKYVE